MKRFFIILAAAVMAITACTKNDVVPVAKDNSITFLPANYAQTKVTGSQFPITETFKTYAWTAGTAGEYFINNETVSYDATVSPAIWKTATTYYWPANQPVDFFSYYPSNLSGLTVGKTQIAFAYDYAANQQDIMYADKAVGYTGNGDGSAVTDDKTPSESGFSGVPTFFRHAGAKLRFKMVAGTMNTTASDSTKTRWEITVNGVELSGIYTKGTATLNLSDTLALGIVPWTAPVDTNGFKVWTNDGTVCDPTTDTKFSNHQVYALTTTGQAATNGDGNDIVIPEFYVLPQSLVAGQQKVKITFDVKTYITPPGLTEFLSTTQTGVIATADLVSTDIPAWQMNQSTVYTLVLNPTGSYVPKPIYWDPAIAPWTVVSGNTNINLNL